MTYNSIDMNNSALNVETEPEELFEYFKRNTKKKEEDFDVFEQAGTFVFN